MRCSLRQHFLRSVLFGVVVPSCLSFRCNESREVDQAFWSAGERVLCGLETVYIPTLSSARVNRENPRRLQWQRIYWPKCAQRLFSLFNLWWAALPNWERFLSMGFPSQAKGSNYISSPWIWHYGILLPHGKPYPFTPLPFLKGLILLSGNN